MTGSGTTGACSTFLSSVKHGRVAAGGCERGLDPFLAHLLRDVFASVLEKARGVGPRGALRLALADRYLDHEK